MADPYQLSKKKLSFIFKLKGVQVKTITKFNKNHGY
jgi:hypothetical protein